jgi:hypothetical protein
VVAKPQLVTTIGANPPGSVTSGSVDGKRIIGAANPGPEDAADLLRYYWLFFVSMSQRNKYFEIACVHVLREL